ncbi:MAG: endonuclease/exonuclease/phosphatase family protein [Proteobacteria bacterium]|nr:endonuclease/exonuclease/phosphatase family protein [Pseudomonadota bacterium]
MIRSLPLLLLVACGGEFSAATYNAGFAVGFVPGANERAPATAAAIGEIDADVVCLQEVWLPEHIAEVEGAASGFAETYFPEAQQLDFDAPACQVDDVQPLIDCMDANCADACADEIPSCLLDNCTLSFVGLEDDCMRCAQANVGGTPEEIFNTCTTGGTEYAYGGSFGTGILSKHPLKSTEELVFDSTTNRRSAIHAVVDAPGGDVDVYCTHLTAVFSSIPYPRAEGSWEEEQHTQVTELLEWIDTSAETPRVVFMGDLNTGPEVGDSISEVDDNYDLIDDAGMNNAYVEAEGECTFCPDNAISSVDSDEQGVVIDHILTSGYKESVASRIIDEQVDIETCGETIPGAHSDHYGVRVSLSR